MLYSRSKRNTNITCEFYKQNCSNCTATISCDGACYITLSPKHFKKTSSGCLPSYPNTDWKNDLKCKENCEPFKKGDNFFCCCINDLCNENYNPALLIEEPTSQVNLTSNSSNKSIPNVTTNEDIEFTGLLIFCLASFIVFLISSTILFIYKRRSRKLTSHETEFAIRSINLGNNANPNDLHSTSYHYRIERENVQVFEEIGAGRFGRVVRALLDKITPAAVKISPQQEYDSWNNERIIYERSQSKSVNLLRYFGSHRDEINGIVNYWLVFECVEGGSLHEYLQAHTVSWPELLKISHGIARGLAQLHTSIPKIAHRDIKSKNILLRDDLEPVVADLSLAAVFDSSGYADESKQQHFLQRGTVRYMAPEILECSVDYTGDCFAKADVYALALVLWEILSRCNPLPAKHYNSSFDENEDVVDNYCLPYEKEIMDMLGGQFISAHSPDILTMMNIVVTNKTRPAIKDRWTKTLQVRNFCTIIEDAWDQNLDSRISAPNVVTRLESLVKASGFNVTNAKFNNTVDDST